ncbi:hypothetical protein SE17_34625, partial [Kouleothrix aurantiaca]
PYTLAYFNPLLGGGPAAARTLLVGWGEGAEQAGAWLRARPDLGAGAVVARNPPTYEPFLPVRVGDLTAKNLTRNPNYVVLYISYLQRQTDPDLNAQVQQNPPLHTVTINGIPYAEIYQMPRPFATPVDTSFGPSIHLRGVTLAQNDGMLTVTPSWDVRQNEERQLFVFVHLLDANGQHVAQLDQPLDPRFPQLQAGQRLASGDVGGPDLRRARAVVLLPGHRAQPRARHQQHKVGVRAFQRAHAQVVDARAQRLAALVGKRQAFFGGRVQRVAQGGAPGAQLLLAVALGLEIGPVFGAEIEQAHQRRLVELVKVERNRRKIGSPQQQAAGCIGRHLGEVALQLGKLQRRAGWRGDKSHLVGLAERNSVAVAQVGGKGQGVNGRRAQVGADA